MKNKDIIYFLIVLIVVAFLIFITINKKEKPVNSQAVKVEQKNTQNIQEIKGVKITVLKKGIGDIVKTGDTVAMNYTGKLSNGTVFDSNVDPKFNHVRPFIFTIGTGQVIKGWDIGVTGMKVGEKRMLEISPKYAYGSVGAGGVIPPNATISFEVELLKIKK